MDLLFCIIAYFGTGKEFSKLWHSRRFKEAQQSLKKKLEDILNYSHLNMARESPCKQLGLVFACPVPLNFYKLIN